MISLLGNDFIKIWECVCVCVRAHTCVCVVKGIVFGVRHLKDCYQKCYNWEPAWSSAFDLRDNTQITCCRKPVQCWR